MRILVAETRNLVPVIHGLHKAFPCISTAVNGVREFMAKLLSTDPSSYILVKVVDDEGRLESVMVLNAFEDEVIRTLLALKVRSIRIAEEPMSSNPRDYARRVDGYEL